MLADKGERLRVGKWAADGIALRWRPCKPGDEWVLGTAVMLPMEFRMHREDD